MSKKLADTIFNGKRVIIRELTVNEVDEEINRLKGQSEPTTLDWLFAEKYMPQASLEKIIGQPVAELMDNETAPSELELLYKKAIEVNDFFAHALGTMNEIGRRMRTLGLDEEIVDMLKTLGPEDPEDKTGPGSGGQQST